MIIKQNLQILSAFLFTTSLLVFSYFSFGPWTTLIFTFGFLGGFILWAIFSSKRVSFSQIQVPYWLTLLFFICHKVEENRTHFQERLADLTGTPVPEISSPALIILLLTSVGGWLLIPYLVKRGYFFGYYFAWTFFASMGIIELAHFIFPFFTNQPYGYFPGMLSVLILAPSAWWGMYRLTRVPRH